MSDDLRLRLLDAEMARVPEAALALQPIENIRETIYNGIDLALKRTKSAEFAQRFHRACPVDGARDEDYLFRVMQTSEGDSAIWGIHFEGRAVRKPFIRIVYSTFDPVRQLESLCEIAGFEFSLFAPLRISFFGAAGLPYDVDTTVYSAPVLQIRDLEKPSHYQRVAVRPESDVSFYPEYEAMYAELRQTNIEPFSSQESRESLQQAVSEGLMFRILIDGDTAGFFGLRKDYDRYLSGYYVIEEVLSTRFRGRGFGAAAQRRAIEELAQPPELVIGMIDHRNVASWRTALRVGRKPVYSAYWYPL